MKTLEVFPAGLYAHLQTCMKYNTCADKRYMMKAWEKNIRQVVPYVPGEQPNKPNMVKLNTNENPYPPAPGVEALAKDFAAGTLRLYPDPTCKNLVEVLAKRYQVAPEQVFVGVGSDDVLATAFMTFFNGSLPIAFPDITYSFYDVWADLLRIPYERKALDEQLHINPRDYDEPNGGVIFPNPNAPTGIYEPVEVVEDILQHNQDVIVIVDEAYVDFAEGGSMQTLLDKYENLLIVQTFSKSRSMAGMRIGFAIGSKRLIKAMSDVKYSYNSYTMNAAALHMGVAAVTDEAYFQEKVAAICKTREEAKVRLAQLGFTFPDSQTNFIFAAPSRISAKELFEKLRERDIYVRYFNQPRINQYLRITVGTPQEMERLYTAIEEIQAGV